MTNMYTKEGNLLKVVVSETQTVRRSRKDIELKIADIKEGIARHQAMLAEEEALLAKCDELGVVDVNDLGIPEPVVEKEPQEFVIANDPPQEEVQ